MTGTIKRMTAPTRSVLEAFLEDPSAPLYGLELMTKTSLPSGTIYPLLTRLETIGWLESTEEASPASELGRPARRFYKLSSAGVVRAHNALAVKHAAHRVRGTAWALRWVLLRTDGGTA